MLEYFTYKKVKKHQAEKKARESETSSPAAAPPPSSSTPKIVTLPPAASSSTATEHEPTHHTYNIPRKPVPVLTKEDEHFLDQIVGEGDEEEDRPPLPVRPSVEALVEAGDTKGNEGQVVVSDGKTGEAHAATAGSGGGGVVDGIRQRLPFGKGKGKETEVSAAEKKEEKDTKKEDKDAKKGNRLSFLGRTFTKKDKKLEPKAVVSPEEAASEKDDINRVLEDLNLAAVNNRAFSISAESQALLGKFTVILKDLVNGVPTAYDDLTHLLDTSQETLEKNYESLPSFLKKLITQLPTKLTGSLAPELLAVAAEAQGLSAEASATAGGAGFGAAAKNFLTPSSLKDLVTKPGAVVSLLKAIMNALKLRWPAFMGTNVLLSLGLFVLLFVFWYCHKRGREERLKRESAAQIVDSEGRIVELPDDPMLSQPGPSRTETPDSQRLRSRERNDRSHSRPSSRLAAERPSSSRRSSIRKSEEIEREGKEAPVAKKPLAED